MRPPRLTLAIAAAVIALDAATKVVMAQALTPGRVVRVLPGVQLDLYYNHAGAGNVLSGRSTLVAMLAILAVGSLAVWSGRARTRRGIAVGLGLLLGGGVGNLADRIFGAPGPLRGGVIDWLRLLGGGGSMNLADLAINAGVIVVVLGAVWSERAARAPGTDGVRASPSPPRS